MYCGKPEKNWQSPDRVIGADDGNGSVAFMDDREPDHVLLSLEVIVAITCGN